ncbi:ATP-binding protein [Sphingomonas albertensis]|uniref:histidine kinase n=1 Tax=Sphingomonas albertensis TaxID=2762591 RepID=A0ABR7AKS4_9SPHN|nr:ATP-binding protein [Sphingomonas albertensis]MBC3941059.1 tetratricopeptide repeat protein [Sphingomonas albertensis]
MMSPRGLAFALLMIAGISISGAAAAQSGESNSKANNYEVTIADAKAAMLIDPDLAGAKARAAEVQAKKILDPKSQGMAVATSKWLQAESFLRANKSSQADAPINEALKLVVKLVPYGKLHADILVSRGGVDSDQGRAGNALQDYQGAYRIYSRLRDARGQAMALLLISMIYNDALDQVAALRYSKQALEIYAADPNLSISIYNNRGVVLSELGQYDAAAEQYIKSLDFARKVGGKSLQARIFNNIARSRLSAGKLDAADAAIDAGLKLATDKDIGGQRAKLIASAAQSALLRGQPKRALDLITEALVGVDASKTGLVYKDFHQTAYDVFRTVDDYKAALVHLQALKRLDDNATKLATSTKTALMAARFDFANQELKISQLKASELQRSIAFERARAQTQRYVFLGASAAVAIVIALLAFGIVTLRRSRDQVRAANDDLAVTNDALGKALAAKTEFLATTSHEIRTPLNGILGMSEVMLADERIEPALRERIGVVHDAGVRMRALVDDILDVAKMETGNLAIESAPFDVCGTITDAARMWEDQARAKGLSFAIELGGCPAMIMGDAARVRQIVFNLLSNALKFTKSGRVTLRIEVDKSDRLHVAVTDSGIGIPADKLEDIFESFRQADAGTTRQFGGTGLGLAICRNLARAMGGDVSVSSIVGQGATFTLVLPVVRAPNAAPEPVMPAEQVAPDVDAVTLVVDRNPITRSMFKTLLAPDFGATAFAASVEDAVARLEGGDVVRVLIDDMTIRACADPHAALSRIAAAALQSGAETSLLWPVSADAERQELLATGITQVISRPVSGGELVTRLLHGSVSNKNANPNLVSHAA